jgi:hypothetical protein
MKQTVFLTAVVVLLMVPLLFGYTPTPAPPLSPSDPNLIPPSPIIGKTVVYTGKMHSGQVDIEEVNGEALTVTGTGLTISLLSTTLIASDPNHLAVKRTYSVTYSPSGVVGIIYKEIIATNTSGLVSKRTLEYRVLQATPPVFTGCRMQ